MSSDERQNVVILNADDLGLCHATNAGILRAAQDGCLTSASILANGDAYRPAVKEVVPHCPNVGIGVHLNISEGLSLDPAPARTALLYDGDGRFCLSYRQLLTTAAGSRLKREIRDEFKRQIDAVAADISCLDHLNSHHHTHAIPALFSIVCDLAAEYSIPFVRLPFERPFVAPPMWCHFRSWYAINVVKVGLLDAFSLIDRRIAARHGVRTNDYFVGIAYTGHMSLAAIERGIRRISKKEEALVEVLLHPAQIVASRDERYFSRVARDFTINPWRKRELETLIDPALAVSLNAGQWLCRSYGQNLNLPSGKQDLSRESREFSTISASSGLSQNPVAIHPVTQTPASSQFKTVIIFDETPFFQPGYLKRLVTECPDVSVCEIICVELPQGGPLQKYLLRNWCNLGIRQFSLLGIKSLLLKLAGKLPNTIKGDFEASLRSVARRYAVPFTSIVSVKTEEFLEHMRRLAPDLIISSNPLIFGDELLNLPKVACINRHSAVLPAFGGVWPVFRSVQYGEEHTGASVHYMVKGVDEGGVLSRKWLPIYKEDTLDRLYRLCFVLSYEATIEAVARLKAEGRPAPLPDEGLKASYFSYPDNEDWLNFKAVGGRFI